MRGPFAIFAVGFRQALAGKRIIALGLVGTIPALVMWLASRNLTPDAVVDRFYDAPVGILFLMVLPICALIIGAGTLGDERRDGTLSFLLLRPIPRWMIVAAKFFAAWLAATMITSLSALAAVIALGVRIGDYGPLLPLIVGVALSTAAYTATFMVLGHLTSRAVLIGLVYVFIWESSITFAAPALANVSLFRIGLTALTAMVPGSFDRLSDVMGSLTPGTWGAVAKAVGISALGVFSLSWMLRRRDSVNE